MSLYDDPKYKFIKDGKFATKVIFFQTADGKTRKRIQFIEIKDEVKIAKPENKEKKAKKKRENFISLF